MNLKVFFGGSLFIGICFAVGVYFSSMKSISLLNTGIQVPAKVVKLIFRPKNGQNSGSGTYTPVFEYSVNNESFIEVSSVSSYPASYEEGERTYLIVNPKKPRQFLEPGFFSIWGVPMLLGLFSFVFSMIGGGGLYFLRRKAKRKAWLAAHGSVVTADIISIGLNTSLMVNGRNPYGIVAQWLDPATGQTYRFDSDPLWSDPSAHVAETIDVRIDRNDPSIFDMVLPHIPGHES